MNTKEDWKVYPLNIKYEASTFGRIRNKETGYILKQFINHRGRCKTTLSENGKPRQVYVARIIATTFNLNLDNKSQVNHINGIKTDNRPDNLEWVTCQENITHAVKNKLFDNKGEKCPASKLTEKEVIEIRSLTGYSRKELSRKFNISSAQIGNIVNNKTWKHLIKHKEMK